MYSLVAISLLFKVILSLLILFMTSILDKLVDDMLWRDFLQYKLDKSHLTKREENRLIEYINNQEYIDIATAIKDGSYTFSIPKKSLISKMGARKKRVVYSYTYSEGVILKYILYLMQDYDHIFAPNCYAFRQGHTVKQAFYSIIDTPNIDSMYAYKVDISDYFNSIDVNILLPKLKDILCADTRLYTLIEALLLVNKSIYNDEVIEEYRGVMAGTTLSTFLANVYLMDLDKYFHSKGILYARYSDDIIVFADTMDKLNEYKQYILDTLSANNLKINPNKEEIYIPHTPWSYIGFEYDGGKIDISKVTLQKIKGKIRRKARSIYRWRIRNHKSTEHAIKVMIRVFNKKFYNTTHLKELSWSKWFYPVISTADSLKMIDEYLLQYIRYLSSGRFTKKNYNIDYDTIKKLGYRSLVNEYYKQKRHS